jgi:hypothetical protein
MKVRMVMLLYKDDYADEFDVEGFAFLKEDDWEYIKREAAATEFPIEIYFGTNEFMEYDTSEEFINMFRVTPITEESIKELEKLFWLRPKESSFGICPYNGCEGHASKEFYDKEGSRLL